MPSRVSWWSDDATVYWLRNASGDIAPDLVEVVELTRKYARPPLRSAIFRSVFGSLSLSVSS